MNLSFSYAASSSKGGEYRSQNARHAKGVGTLEDALFESLDVRLSESESTRRSLNDFLRVNRRIRASRLWRQ